MVASRMGTVTSFVIPRIHHTLQSTTTRRMSIQAMANSYRMSHADRIGISESSRISRQLHQQPANNGGGDSEYGVNMDQEALMESDKLVAVDEYDRLIETSDTTSLTKRAGHTFNEATPRAILHRAFSFFLFDRDNRLLLTQRSADKITFPNVWTNTVCSHPLYDMIPNEVDIVPDAYPSFPGIKHAAIRKCKHELGIDKQYLPHDAIQFITRYHYWAADTITYGPTTPWGEHEVDYILFLRTDNASEIPITPTPEEVSNYKFVTITELQEMLQQPNLLWSPWFIGILERGGWDYWKNLDTALAGHYTNNDVTFFDPPAQHIAQYNLPSHTRQTGVLIPSASAYKSV